MYANKLLNPLIIYRLLGGIVRRIKGGSRGFHKNITEETMEGAGEHNKQTFLSDLLYLFNTNEICVR